jgi:phosphatidylinositol alpha-1,6-mannosyltransferase
MISRSIPDTGDIEGFGIVYLEANLLKKPVIAGDSGGVPDAVVHGQTGLLVDPTDSQAVAVALITLLQDRALAQQLGQQGYDRVVTEFSSDAAAEKVYARLQAVWGA